MARLRITLRKSAIGRQQRQRETVRSLGFKRLGQTVEHDDTPAVRGQINAVRHLVSVEEVES